MSFRDLLLVPRRLGISDAVSKARLTPAERAERGERAGRITGALPRPRRDDDSLRERRSSAGPRLDHRRNARTKTAAQTPLSATQVAGGTTA